MDLGPPTSGAWMEPGLTFLLGGFQCFWTFGADIDGAVRSLDLESTALQPDPKPGPKKSLYAKCLRGNTQRSGPSRGTELSGHRDGGPVLRLQH